MKIVVGLGNPGKEYVGTRHNVGWEAIDQVAARLGWVTGGPGAFETFAKSKFDGLTIDGALSLHSTGGTEKVLLLKPLTYMNLSGRSVQAALSFYQLTPADCLIVLDDLALPCGKIRLRGAGSPGGHNGLKSIETSLDTDKYPRLRIGIDMPPPRVPQRDYVLGKFTPDQRPLVEQALARAAGAVVTWVDKGLNAAMNQFNKEES
ncbi:MAG: aminoacyl-tRNA hydrolase [Phycisphaerae bacterium]|nr:aminoacyl-tRNA hydrolase [Tepidisphaeraceae bacterium]